jgi:translocator protein
MTTHALGGGSRAREWVVLAGFLVVTALAAVTGSLAAIEAAAEYAQLEQPPWAPPSGVFGPVWTVLYVLIAVAAWLVWRRAGGFAAARAALTAWLVQLALNAAWTPLFFGQEQFGLAFAEILVLDVAVVTTAVLFARHQRLAAGLLLPYLAWLAFATALNFAVWQLNT